jgi:hypothetical protein
MVLTLASGHADQQVQKRRTRLALPPMMTRATPATRIVPPIDDRVDVTLVLSNGYRLYAS